MPKLFQEICSANLWAGTLGWLFSALRRRKLQNKYPKKKKFQLFLLLLLFFPVRRMDLAGAFINLLHSWRLTHIQHSELFWNKKKKSGTHLKMEIPYISLSLRDLANTFWYMRVIQYNDVMLFLFSQLRSYILSCFVGYIVVKILVFHNLCSMFSSEHKYFS